MTANEQTQWLYPLDLPPLPDLDAASLKKAGLWNALEFFRIEALLRSKPVHTLYVAVRQKADLLNLLSGATERWKSLARHVFKRPGETTTNVFSFLSDETPGVTR